MRAKEFLTETLSRIVYHYTTLWPAAKILSSGEFALSSSLGSVELQYAPEGHPYFLSTTRTKTGGYHNHVGSQAVMFVLDGDYYNTKYPSKPIDYWGNRSPDNAYGRKHEAEDRLFSKEPTISIGGVTSVHVLVTPDADPNVKAKARTVLIAAKKRGIPVIYYDDKDAWQKLDTRKSAPVIGLTGQEKTGYHRSHRGYLLPWMEVLQAKTRSQLSSKSLDIVRGLARIAPETKQGYTYYRDETARGLSTELSNARKPDSGNDREHAVRIIQYMRDNKLNTVNDLIDNLAEKWTTDKTP